MDYKDKYEKAVQAAMLAKQDTESAVTIGILEEIFPELRVSEDEVKPNGGIVMENFNEGNGFYKVNLAFLNKEQVEEIEDIVKKWNPELAESKDESIRKEIINYFKCQSREELSRKETHNKWIAWLKKAIIPSHNDIDSSFIEDIKNVIDEAPLLMQSDKEKMIAWLEKQGEQKPVEPQQDMLSQEKYAKAVDECIYGEQKPNPCDGCVNRKGCINCENGELRETEQKPSWSEEDEKMIRGLIVICDEWTTRHSFYPIENCEIEKLKNWLESLKDRVLPQPKQEWKQENTDDLTKFENSMMHIGNSFFGDNAGLDPNDTNTIKEQANLLLELVPKQEWSEEDERIYKVIVELLNSWSNGTIDGCIIPPNTNRYINWFKSLKERYTWKPSDEQMLAINTSINIVGKDTINGKYLIELAEQLKKLREESSWKS